MKILKFGRASIGTPERIARAVSIIEQDRASVRAVVVSAMNGATDELGRIGRLAAEGDESYREGLAGLERMHLDIVKSSIGIRSQSHLLAEVKALFNELDDILQGVFLIKEWTPKTQAFVLSFGERASASILAGILARDGDRAEYLDARKLIATDANFGTAGVDFESTNAGIRRYFLDHPDLQVVAGSIGSTAKGETASLGRAGSDYTAAILGAVLGADEVEIWAADPGVMTADPNKVPEALTIPQMTYEEAMEMSHFRAGAIYPPSMQPLLEHDIPLRIRNVLRPEWEGTEVRRTLHQSHPGLIRGISSISGISLIRVQGSGMIGVVGIAGRLFSALAREKVNVILIAQASSEHSICAAVSGGESEKAVKVLEQEFALEIRTHPIDPVVVENELSILAVVGVKMQRTPGIAARIFKALGAEGINVIAAAQGSSELNVSIVIKGREEAGALKAIHAEFFGADGNPDRVRVLP